MDIAETLKLKLRNQRTISWCDLPGEILVSISKLLDDQDDVIKLRAVCSSWRSSVAPPHRKKPFLPVTLPILNYISPAASYNLGYFKLSAPITIYHLKWGPISADLNSSRRNGWLVRVLENENGEYILLNPFGGRIDLFSPSKKTLNSLDFRKSEIAKGYRLQLVNTANHFPHFRVYMETLNVTSRSSKVCVSSRPVSTADDYVVIVLTNRNELLRHIKFGGDKWVELNQINYHHLEPGRRLFARDIMEYACHFYVVDNYCKVVKFDCLFRVVGTRIASACENCPCTPHFVECNGNLLLVHKRCYDIKNDPTASKPSKIKVYKLDGDNPMIWRQVKDLGDSILFICRDCCFSVSAQDFPGLKGNCVYFEHDFDGEFANDAICKGSSGFPIYVFNLDDGSVGPLVSHPDNSSILWSIPC